MLDNILDHNYLALHMMSLKRGVEWAAHTGGLSFVLPKKGVGSYACDSLILPLLPGDILVLSGSETKLLADSSNDEFQFEWFTFDIERLYPLFRAKDLCLVTLVADGFKNGKRYPASSDLAIKCHRFLEEIPPQFSLDYRCQLLKTIVAILTTEISTSEVSRAGLMQADEQMTKTFAKLKVDDIVTLPIGELARRFSCSQRHLNRLFHAHFGISVAGLRMELRLLKAVALLQKTITKVSDVAALCGFNHLGLFNTCFKRRFGSSPGKWRHNIHEGIAASQGEPIACGMSQMSLCPWSWDPKGCSGDKSVDAAISRKLFAGNGGCQNGISPAGGHAPMAAGRNVDCDRSKTYEQQH